MKRKKLELLNFFYMKGHSMIRNLSSLKLFLEKRQRKSVLLRNSKLTFDKNVNEKEKKI